MGVSTTYRTVEIHTTSDGKEFVNRKDALEHEEQIQRLKYFKIRYGPDLTEGKHGPKSVAYMVVNARVRHDKFAEYACYEIFGNPYVMAGVFGSNAIMENWILEPLNKIPEDVEVHFSVEDKFTPKEIWGPGIHTWKKV